MNKSSHLYLYSAFNNTNCVKATAQYQNRNIFELKAFHYWIQWCYRPAQFSLNNICAIKSMISLAMKCPQLSKPEETAARVQNSIGDRTEKKPWEKPGSVGGPVLLWPDEPVVFFSNCSKVRSTGSSGLFPMAVWARGPHWRSVSGEHTQQGRLANRGR